MASVDTIAGMLARHKILLVEDETALSFLIEDMLHEMGADEVTHAASVNDAFAVLETIVPTLALLDVNLGGQRVYPVAELLLHRNIPFIFVTGYGRDGVDQRWASRPVLQKPIDLAALEATIKSALGG